MKNKFDIRIFVMPVGACSYEKSWQYAIDMISKKLKDRLGDVFEMKLIEMFSPESFSFKEILEGIQNEKLQTPVVTINGNIIQSGGKLSERAIRMEIEKQWNLLIGQAGAD
jgi:disulfide oxidoreductase YuzD